MAVSLSELQDRAERLEQDLIELIGHIDQRGVPDCERACGDAQADVTNLVALLTEAAAVDPRDELPVDGGIVP